MGERMYNEMEAGVDVDTPDTQRPQCARIPSFPRYTSKGIAYLIRVTQDCQDQMYCYDQINL